MEAAHASIVAGSVAGMLSVTVCHPFDVVRTIIQTQGSSSSSSSSSVYKDILPQYVSGSNGSNSSRKWLKISRLYKGFLPPFLSQGLYKSIIFTTNTISSQLLFSDNSPRGLFPSLVTGFLSGLVCSTVVSPIEILRSRLIIEQGVQVNFTNCVKILLKEGGFASLWRALPLTMLRDAPGVALYLSTFAMVKQVSKMIVIQMLCSYFSFSFPSFMHSSHYIRVVASS